MPLSPHWLSSPTPGDPDAGSRESHSSPREEQRNFKSRAPAEAPASACGFRLGKGFLTASRTPRADGWNRATPPPGADPPRRAEAAATAAAVRDGQRRAAHEPPATLRGAQPRGGRPEPQGAPRRRVHGRKSLGPRSCTLPRPLAPGPGAQLQVKQIVWLGKWASGGSHTPAHPAIAASPKSSDGGARRPASYLAAPRRRESMGSPLPPLPAPLNARGRRLGHLENQR